MTLRKAKVQSYWMVGLKVLVLCLCLWGVLNLIADLRNPTALEQSQTFHSLFLNTKSPESSRTVDLKSWQETQNLKNDSPALTKTPENQ